MSEKDNKLISDLTNELMSDGYNLGSINQIIKGYKQGSKAFLNISPSVESDEIRKLYEGFLLFYDKDEMDTLVEILNEHIPIENFVDKKHSSYFIDSLHEDLKKGNNIYYITKEDDSDYSDKHIKFLRNLGDKAYDYLTPQQIDKIKNNIMHKYNKPDLLKILSNKEDIDQKLKYLERGYPIENCIALLAAKKICPELMDKLEGLCSEKINIIVNEYVGNEDNVRKYIDKIRNLTPKDMETFFRFIKRIDIDDIIEMDITIEAKINMMDLKSRDFDKFELSKEFMYYKVFNDCDRYFERFLGKLQSTDKQIMPFLLEELENNEDAEIEDLRQIIDGFNFKIDINKYITNKDQLTPYDSEEKEFIKEILKFNLNHPDEQIDLDKIIDEDREFIIDSDKIYILTEALKSDINISNLLELDREKIENFLEAVEEYPLTTKQIYLLNKYKDMIIDDNDIYFLTKLLNKGYEIVNEHDIYNKSVDIYKQLDKLKSADEFCAHIIDKKLTDENCEQLINILNIYLKSSEKLKEFYRYTIETENYTIIDPDLTDEKVDVIIKDIKDGIGFREYMNNKFSLEQIKMFSEICHNGLKISDGYFKNEFERKVGYLMDPNFSIEQLEFIKNYIKSNYLTETLFMKPEYSVEQMSFYLQCYNKIWTYDYSLHRLNEKICDEISNQVRKIFYNIDKNAPLEEQKKYFLENEKNVLQNAAEKVSDMDTKFLLYNLLNKLEPEKNIDSTEINEQNI